MKKGFILWILLGMICLCQAGERKYSTYYYQKASLFERLPVSSSDIIFLGNSITDGGEWAELFGDSRIKNRGISGDISEGVYDRLGPVLRGKPAKIFLMIGINDVSRGTAADTIVKRIRKIAGKIAQESPDTRLYIQSLLPVNDCYGMFQGHTSRGKVIVEINRQLQEFCQGAGLTYIDLYSHFCQADGKMNPVYTNDGLHLLGEGYLLWKKILLPYIKK